MPVVGVHLQEDAEADLGLAGVPLGEEGVDLLDRLLDRLLLLVDGFQALDLGKHGGGARAGGRGA